LGILFTAAFFSLNAALIPHEAYTSAEEDYMDGVLRKLACGMLLLALVGSVSAGFGAAEKVGTRAPENLPVAGSSHGDRGLLAITGDPGDLNTAADVRALCYFPIWRLPEYYVCIMFCKIGGGGDSCAQTCEAKLMICTYT
jgi:hypothetical protein